MFFKFISESRLLNLLDTKVNLTAYYFHREREREAEVHSFLNVIGMKTPIYNCYYVYSRVSDKYERRSLDNDRSDCLLYDSIS